MMKNTDRLFMFSLGIVGDTPPLPSLQPPLDDGIHLRWDYGRLRGFPWYGTHLLRRRSEVGVPVCLGDFLQAGGTLFSADATSFAGCSLSSSTDLSIVKDQQGRAAVALTAGTTIQISRRDLRPLLDLRVSIDFSAAGRIQLLGYMGDQLEVDAWLENPDPTPQRVEYSLPDRGVNRILLKAQSLAANALVSLCFSEYPLQVNQAWQPLPDFIYPLSLPLASPAYPCASAPASQGDALALALSRTTLEPQLIQDAFPQFHDLLQQMVQGGVSAGPMAGVKVDLSTPNPATRGHNAIRFTVHDMLMLAALDAQAARVLGLYWTDRSVPPGAAYDYLLWPDHAGDFHQMAAQDIAAKIEQTPWPSVVEKGCILYQQSTRQQTPVPTPTGLQVYALPGTGVSRSLEQVVNSYNNAGFRWQLPTASSASEQPVAMYHLWRAGAASTGTTAHEVDGFELLTHNEPVVIDRSESGTQNRPPGWPAQRMYSIDSSLDEGRHEYRVSAVDLFGRHSGLSQAADVLLVDDTLPPPPTGIEASLLDPNDKWLVRDQAYKDWQNTLTEQQSTAVIGLRVSWRWPRDSHAAAAPDVEEFRVYLHNGLFNTRFGHLANVKKGQGGTSTLLTDLASSEPDDSYQGASITCDGRAYRVVSSTTQGGQLQLGMENHLDEQLKPSIAPQAGAAFSLALVEKNQSAQPPFADTSDPHAWGTALQAGIKQVKGQERYELFLTIAEEKGDGTLLDVPSLAAPLVYGQVAVTAVRKQRLQSAIATHARVVRVLRDKPSPPAQPFPDGAAHQATAPDYHNRSYYTYQWSQAAHEGLGSHVFRALDETLFQVDWERGEQGFPTLDPKVDFPPDWSGKEGLIAQVKSEIEHIHTLPRGATPSQQQLADAQARAHYRGLSNNALRALAGLGENAPAFSQVTTTPYGDRTSEQRDQLEGRSRGRYFYRACFVDAAHNRGLFSASSPPVELPNTVAPQTPTFNRVAAGERELTLHWNASPDADVHSYLIYHSQDRAAAQDIRSMGAPLAEVQAPNSFEIADESEYEHLDQVYWVVPLDSEGEEQEAQAPDSICALPKQGGKWSYKVRFSVNRNAAYAAYLVYRSPAADAFAATANAELVDSVGLDELSWTMAELPPRSINYFRIVAVDKDGNHSDSALAVGAPVAMEPPDPPEWKSAQWIKDQDGDDVISLTWTATEDGGQCMVQRRSEFAPNWVSISDWLVSETRDFGYADTAVEDGLYEYRLVFLSSSGVKNEWFRNRAVAAITA